MQFVFTKTYHLEFGIETEAKFAFAITQNL